ncbi:MAG TPA: CBS domain-containing protein [Candidatus Tenderia sp.]|nr:CBS domain-containing protein [Candidatus Tenderia sp.]
MNVSHILSKKGGSNYSVTADQPLNDAVAMMAEHRIGSVVVLENGALKSIMTERDVLMALGRKGDLSQVKVSDVMAPKLITCAAETTIDEAMDTMINNDTGRRIRHLPVVSGDEFLGMLSIGDVVEALLTKTKFENKLLKSYIQNWPDEEG